MYFTLKVYPNISSVKYLIWLMDILDSVGLNMYFVFSDSLNAAHECVLSLNLDVQFLRRIL